MKTRILDFFKQSQGVVSGEDLSRSIGISRVAVWKHIRQLQKAGYSIESTSKGYRLLDAPDTPFAWALGNRAAKIHYYPQVASTMESAMMLARKGCEDFTVVVADRQTQGRGRLQRTWQSGAGGLYFTIILRPQVPPADTALINLAAAVDLAAVLEDRYDIRARLKWPNDVLVDGCKIAGILSQMVTEPDRVDFLNLGIGINVNNDPGPIVPPAISISRIKRKEVSRVELLQFFLDRFEARLNAGRLQEVVPQWKQMALTLGRKVKIQTFQECLEGVAVDMEANGALVVKTADGGLRTVVYGDCFHQEG